MRLICRWLMWSIGLCMIPSIESESYFMQPQSGTVDVTVALLPPQLLLKPQMSTCSLNSFCDLAGSNV